ESLWAGLCATRLARVPVPRLPHRLLVPLIRLGRCDSSPARRSPPTKHPLRRTIVGSRFNLALTGQPAGAGCAQKQGEKSALASLPLSSSPASPSTSSPIAIMQLIATLAAFVATLALVQAAPAVDRVAIVAANRARLSSELAAASSSSAASVASVASVASAAARQSSISSVRNAIVSSNRARLSAELAAKATPSGFVTVPSSARPTPTPAPSAPASAASSSASSASSSSASFIPAYPGAPCAAHDQLCWLEVNFAEVVGRLDADFSRFQATCTGYDQMSPCTGPYARPSSTTAPAPARSSIAQ
ncbi:hypothetical protein DMC30DRAFT_434468, partial [Rhodotorula diobovata]